MAQRREFTRRSDRIQELVSRLQNEGDPAVRAIAQELLQAVIELHGIAFERILDAIEALPDNEVVTAQLIADDLVSNVLSLHGLNPIPVETRVEEALDKARPYLKSHGGDVELGQVEEDGTVRVRLQGTCGSCSSSTETLRNSVEDAIYSAAPEVAAVISEAMPRPQQPDLVILRTN